MQRLLGTCQSKQRDGNDPMIQPPEMQAIHDKKVHKETTNPLNANREDSLWAVIQVAYFADIGLLHEAGGVAHGRGLCGYSLPPETGKGVPAILVELKWNKSTVGVIRQITDK